MKTTHMSDVFCGLVGVRVAAFNNHFDIALNGGDHENLFSLNNCLCIVIHE